MNTHLFRMAFMAMGLALLTGCGVEATAPAHHQAAVANVDQPASLAGQPPAPDGWRVTSSAHAKSHLAPYRGETISELEPIVFQATKRL